MSRQMMEHIQCKDYFYEMRRSAVTVRHDFLDAVAVPCLHSTCWWRQ